MDTKHTKGPYRLLVTSNAVHVRVGRGALEYDWSQPLYGGEDAEDDAETIATGRLFAAAPNLLDALKAMVLNMRTDGHEYRDCFKAAETAIAKATEG